LAVWSASISQQESPVRRVSVVRARGLRAQPRKRRGSASPDHRRRYWYIHPEQHRTLSIREAARVQSFPDWFRFAGYKTSALKQIGEAVAPFVAEAIGRKMLEFIGPTPSRVSRPSSRLVDKHLKVRSTLQIWYRKETKRNSLHPWRLEANLWLFLLGEILFAGRSHSAKGSLFWMNCRNDWPDPKSYLKDKHRPSHLRTLGMGKQLPTLEGLASYLAANKAPVVRDLVSIGIPETLAHRAMALSGLSQARPDDTNLIRVANRVKLQNTQPRCYSPT